MGHKSSVSNQVVDTTLADYLGSVNSSLLEAGVAGQVSIKDMDIGALSQLCCHLLLGRNLVTDQTND